MITIYKMFKVNLLTFVLLFSSCVPASYEVPKEIKKTLDKTDLKIQLDGTNILKPSSQGTTQEEIKKLLDEESEKSSDSSLDSNSTHFLDIESLRKIVLEKNLGIKVLEQNIDIANEELNSEKAKFDALFTNKIEYLNADLPTGNSNIFNITSIDSSFDNASGVFTEASLDREQLKTSTGIDIPNMIGGIFSLSQNFEIDDKSTSSLISQEDRAGLRLSLSQPLLRGAGIDVNTASIKLSRYSLGQINAQTKLATIRVLANAEKAYWSLYGALKMYDVAKQQYRIAEQNLKALKTRIKLGDVAPVERFAAELSLAQQLDALIHSEIEVRLKRRKLKLFMNSALLPVVNNTEITIKTEPKLNKFNLVRADLVDKALSERLDLLSLDLSIASAEIEIKVAKNKTLPYFSLDFEYGTSDRDSTLSSSFLDSLRFDNQGYRLGSSFSLPLTNKAARANLRQKKEKGRKQVLKKEEKILRIKTEVLDAADALEREWQRILAARQNVVSASANYDAEKSLFKEGQRSAQNVLIALQQLGSARQKEVKTIVAYQSDQVDLAFATGVLLGYAGYEVR